MPRPGPRPYECVRRAWHSDRHQPMRGSLIQEIFRIVNESHSSATKKNKEWQEKLPIVVLKAEEIMYFKANSEAEYIDLKTLWDRVNDAIDTIIKRDESSETGELLQPCIEAALHLGCTPRRTSRSQRNNSTVCYLSSRDPPEAPSSSPISLRDKIHGKPNVFSQFLPLDVRFMTPNTINPSAFHSFETDTSRVVQNRTSSDPRFPFSPENNVSRCVSQRLPASPNSHSVFPLYFGSEFDKNNLLSPHQLKGDSGCIWKNTPGNHSGPECDLSLRLGPVDTLLQEKPNGNPGMSREGSKSGYPPPPHFNPSFSFPNPVSRKAMISQSQEPNVEVMLKKQKVVTTHLYEDRQFCYPLKLPFNHIVGKMRNAGP